MRASSIIEQSNALQMDCSLCKGDIEVSCEDLCFFRRLKKLINIPAFMNKEEHPFGCGKSEGIPQRLSGLMHCKLM